MINKPNIWFACFLGIFLQPFGHWYIGKLKWAFFYLFLSFAVTAGDYYLQLKGIQRAAYHPLKLAFALVSLVHIIYLLKFNLNVSQRQWYSRWYSVCLLIVSFAVIVFGFRAFIYEPFSIPSQSMAPTLKVGDQIIVSKWGYGNYSTYGLSIHKEPLQKEITKGDLIVFEYPKDPQVSFVKRVIGTAGDLVEINGKQISVNNELVHQSLVYELDGVGVYQETLNHQQYHIQLHENRPGIKGSWLVPSNTFFVMGDNRDNSNDSRYWGFVLEAQLIGKVKWVMNTR